MPQYTSLTALIPRFTTVTRQHQAALPEAVQQVGIHKDGRIKVQRTPGFANLDEVTFRLVQDWIHALYDAWDATTCYDVLGERGIDPRTCLANKSFSTLDTLSVLALMTWITRGDRFTSGFIEDHIEDGSILALLRRLEDLDGAATEWQACDIP